MQSLLGQFYSRIRGSQEDIASEGLVYILQRSKSARLALNRIIKSDCGLEFGNLSFKSQNIGDQLERPDISGIDADGNEVLIMEAKFWAALTDNQPIEYLRRLKPNAVLVFICPTLRVRPVFDEIIRRIKITDRYFTPNLSIHSIPVEENKHLIIKTWDEILGTIKIHLEQDNEKVLISDIDQIIGLCNAIDTKSFLPIQSDDLSPKYARRISSYYDLLDKVVDELRKREFVDLSGLKATPQRYGYTRYLKVEKYGVALNFNMEFWAEIADTPFWLSIKEIVTPSKWKISAELRRESKTIASVHGFTLHETINRDLYFALFPLLDKTEDVVINDLTDNIILLLTNLQRQMNPSNRNTQPARA